MKAKESPAIQLLRLVEGDAVYTAQSRSRSWRQIYDVMGAALALAIRSNLRFERGDFALIAADSGAALYGLAKDGEAFYAMACHSRDNTGERTYKVNQSACAAFEHWKKRRPFVLGGKRIAVGTWFRWGGTEVTCTSFGEDGTYLVACRYRHPTKGDYTGRRKIAGYYRITHEQLQAANRAARKNVKREE